MEQLDLFAAGEESPSSLTVSQVTARVKGLLESDRLLRNLWVEGEISNWRPSTSGHIYFTLKDEKASLRCIMWRSTARDLTYLPSGDGEAILAHGHVSVYEPQGAYQFYVDDMQPIGIGSLYAQFEQLKARLTEEGLFEQAQRPLPAFPRRIGIVTSPTAAALRDILNVLGRRYPLVEIILSPSLVQGAEAPPQIVAALQALTQVPDVAVIILARGGGSLEDLWAFNDESVARTVAASPIPVVCGVGHETDFTIADFAADLRAPTPSAAAELVTPDGDVLVRQLAYLKGNLTTGMSGTIEYHRQNLTGERRALQRLSPQSRIDQLRQRVDELAHSAQSAIGYQLALNREQIASRDQQLAALNPKATLERGYAIVRHLEDDQIVSRVEQVREGDRLSVQVSDGTFESSVQDRKV